MAGLVLPSPSERVLLSDGRMNPVWYRFLAAELLSVTSNTDDIAALAPVKGTFTLTSGAISDTIPNPLCTATSVPLWAPMTFDAANEIATGLLYLLSVNAGNFVLSTSGVSVPTRTFRYVLIG